MPLSNELIIDCSLVAKPESLVRSCISLALITQRPVHFTNFLNGGGGKGLERRHITMLDVSRAIGKARLENVALKETSFSFKSQTICAGAHSFSVGSAGTATEILESVILPLCVASAPSNITVYGSTHTSSESNYDFFSRNTLALYRYAGLDVNARLHHSGWAPLGVGKVSLEIGGSQLLRRFHLTERGVLRAKSVECILRSDSSWEIESRRREVIQALDVIPTEVLIRPCPNIRDAIEGIIFGVDYGNISQAVITYSGKNKEFSDLLREVNQDYLTFAESNAPVNNGGAYTLLPLLCASGGGAFLQAHLSDEELYLMEICTKFFAVEISIESFGGGKLVTVSER